MARIDRPPMFRRLEFNRIQIEEEIKDHAKDVAKIMVKAVRRFNMPILLELPGYDWMAYPGETIAQVVKRLKKHQEDE